MSGSANENKSGVASSCLCLVRGCRNDCDGGLHVSETVSVWQAPGCPWIAEWLPIVWILTHPLPSRTGDMGSLNVDTRPRADLTPLKEEHIPRTVDHTLLMPEPRTHRIRNFRLAMVVVLKSRRPMRRILGTRRASLPEMTLLQDMSGRVTTMCLYLHTKHRLLCHPVGQSSRSTPI